MSVIRILLVLAFEMEKVDILRLEDFLRDQLDENRCEVVVHMYDTGVCEVIGRERHLQGLSTHLHKDLTPDFHDADHFTKPSSYRTIFLGREKPIQELCECYFRYGRYEVEIRTCDLG